MRQGIGSGIHVHIMGVLEMQAMNIKIYKNLYLKPSSQVRGAIMGFFAKESRKSQNLNW